MAWVLVGGELHRKVCRVNEKDAEALASALELLAKGHVGVEVRLEGDSPAEIRIMEAARAVSDHLEEVVSMAHEFAMGLAEHFNVLHRVRGGDLDARITYRSTHEILEYSRELTNSTIERLADEIRARRKTQAELSKLVAAVEQTADGIVVTDARGRCEYVNPAFVEMTGFTRRELVGMPLKIIDATGPDSDRIFREMTEAVMAGNVWRGVLPSRKKDGGLFMAESSVSPVRDEAGKISEYVVVKRDVTHELEIKHRLEQSQKLEALGTLSGGIAHELNNILTPIIGYTELVLDEEGHSPRVKKNLQQILVASERARTILWKILAFSRRDEEEGEVRDGVRLSEVIRETLDLFAATIPPTIKVEFQPLTSGEDAVCAGVAQLQQVLLNLAMNAVAAIPDRSGTIKITIREPGQESIEKFMKDPASDRYLEVVVADDGEGIPAADLERIFEPFYTTKPIGQGTGLGLSVVHGIIRNYGGFINVESTPGVGTSFHIFLPRAFTVGAKTVEAQAETAATRGSERLMLVDDEEAVVNVFRLQLESLGYKVDAYTQPTSALAAFMRNPRRFDLLLTDNAMPLMSGVVLASEVKLVRPDLPVIICTGHSQNLTSDQFVELGQVEILNKPVMLRELSKTVRTSLDKAEDAARGVL